LKKLSSPLLCSCTIHMFKSFPFSLLPPLPNSHGGLCTRTISIFYSVKRNKKESKGGQGTPYPNIFNQKCQDKHTALKNWY
jgi:hypothetical protein